MSRTVIPIIPHLSPAVRRRRAALIDDAVRQGQQRELMVLLQGLTKSIRFASREWKYSHAPLRAAERLDHLAQVLRELHSLGEQRRALSIDGDLE